MFTNKLNNNKDKGDIDVKKIKEIKKNEIKINKLPKPLIKPLKKLRRISLLNLIQPRKWFVNFENIKKRREKKAARKI